MLAQKDYEQQSQLQLFDSAQQNTHVRVSNVFPSIEANRPVQLLIEALLGHWPGCRIDQSDPAAPHEASLIHLTRDLAQQQLGWQPRWTLDICLERTARWYRQLQEGGSPFECCLADLKAYKAAAHAH